MPDKEQVLRENLPGPYWVWIPPGWAGVGAKALTGVSNGLKVVRFPGGKPRPPSVLGGTGWIRLLGAAQD